MNLLEADRRRFEDYVAAASRLRQRQALRDGRLCQVRVVAYISLESGKLAVVGGAQVLDEWVDSFAVQMRKFHMDGDAQHFHTTRGRVGFVLHQSDSPNSDLNDYLKELRQNWNNAEVAGTSGAVNVGSAGMESGSWAKLSPKDALERWLNGHWAHQEGDKRRERDGIASLAGGEALDGAMALQVLAARVEPVLKLARVVEAVLADEFPTPNQVDNTWYQGIRVPPERLWFFLGPSVSENAEAVFSGRPPPIHLADVLTRLAEARREEE